MSEHETRAREIRERWNYGALTVDDLFAEFDKALSEAHSAGFEAGLRARMPNEELWAKAFDKEFGDPNKEVTGWQVFYFCQKWLAANMRKGDE